MDVPGQMAISRGLHACVACPSAATPQAVVASNTCCNLVNGACSRPCCHAALSFSACGQAFAENMQHSALCCWTAANTLAVVTAYASMLVFSYKVLSSVLCRLRCIVFGHWFLLYFCVGVCIKSRPLLCVVFVGRRCILSSQAAPVGLGVLVSVHATCVKGCGCVFWLRALSGIIGHWHWDHQKHASWHSHVWLPATGCSQVKKWTGVHTGCSSRVACWCVYGGENARIWPAAGLPVCAPHLHVCFALGRVRVYRFVLCRAATTTTVGTGQVQHLLGGCVSAC